MAARARSEAQSLMEAVLDASAVLALYFDEPGAESVRAVLPGPLLSSVNYAEIIGKALDRGVINADILRKLAMMGFTVVPYDISLARRTGELLPLTKRYGLSLADRACLALAERERLPVLTADRKWATLGLKVDVRLIR